VLGVIAALVYCFLLAPLVIVAGTALSDTEFLAFPPHGLTVRWFEAAFGVQAFIDTFWVSFRLALLATGLALALGIPAAYALARFALPGRAALRTLFVLPILVPEVAFGFAALAVLNQQVGLKLFPTLLLAHLVVLLPYTVRVISASLASFDFSAEEAAVSLGANRLKAFFVIVLPNVRSGVIAAFILSFITSLNNVPISLFLTGPGYSTLPIQMLTHIEYHFDPTVAALSVMLMALTAGVMIIVERTLGLSYFAR
jgi:putative spermidine/putrescine transport system permease protein